MAQTKRTKAIKADIETITKNVDTMETAWQKYVEFFNEWNGKLSIYSVAYVNGKCDECRAATMKTVHACAEKAIDAALRLQETLETDPEPVNVNDTDAQNALAMIKLTNGNLEFNQLIYLIDRSRGNLSLLKMLANVFDNYKLDYAARRARDLAADPSQFRIANIISELHSTLYETEQYYPERMFWDCVELKKYAKNLDPTITEAPDYEAQVQKLKKQLRAAEEERDAAKAEAADKAATLHAAAERIVDLEGQLNTK